MHIRNHIYAGLGEILHRGFKQLLLVLCLLLAPMAEAEETMIENFEAQPETRWRFFTDGVMGGVSSGKVTFLREDDTAFARMTGKVSTENNGGFIQMRLDLPDGAPDNATGVRIVVRGNDQRYFVHLRSQGTVLPWQYYQAGFDVTKGWAEVRVPFTAFKRSGRMLRSVPKAKRITSVAIVAYGRDHDAEIDVREIGFF